MAGPGNRWRRLRWEIARRQRQWLRSWIAWAFSLCVHAALTLWGLALVSDEPAPVDPPRPAAVVDDAIGIELVEMLLPAPEDVSPDARVVVDSEPLYGGGERPPRPDTERAGRGGDEASLHAAVNLAPRNDEAHLTPQLRSRMDRAQVVRRNNGGRERRSPEDDTVDAQPMILTFVADGPGSRFEPRHDSAHDPSGGAFAASRARRAGAGLGFDELRPRGGLDRAYPSGDGADGNAAYDANGAGVRDRAAGRDTRASADVARARPMALRGVDSAPSDRRGSASDHVDAEQEVSARSPSLLAASGPGGQRGLGRGGESGPGAVGSGGVRGPGSISRALGSGRGNGTAIDPADARRRSYLRRVRSRIQSNWSAASFPKRAVLAGRSGYTIVSFVIGRGGEVSSVVTARRSGFPGFDAAMRRAVQSAAPFGKPPSDLRPPFRFTHPFVVKNPAVRRTLP